MFVPASCGRSPSPARCATRRCRTCRPSRNPVCRATKSSLWQAIVAPAATPPAIVARLNRETVAVLNDPDVRAAFAKHGVEAEPGTPEALGARIRDDVKKWRDVVSGAGIKAQ